MNLSAKSLECLRDMINEKTQYRTGGEIQAFFRQNGVDSSYNGPFPSRWIYTDGKLARINGTPELDKCIKSVFAPINFINRTSDLVANVEEFNQYIAFDGWKVSITNTGVEIHRTDLPNVEKKIKEETSNINDAGEDKFLNLEFNDEIFTNFPIKEYIKPIIEQRFIEIKQCFTSKAYLSTIIMCGSTLEGILLDLASSNPRLFNTAKASPKDNEGKVRSFQNWTLKDFIDVSAEVKILGEDVKKFSHVLREFRNYVHPHSQMSTHFFPTEHTAKISMQVLKAAICQITDFQKKSI